MRPTLPLGVAGVLTAASFVALSTTLTGGSAFAAPAATAYALSGTNLLAIDTTTATAVATRPITNIAAGDTLVGIDVRPVNGYLYALGVNAAADTATVYVLSPQTGFAGAVGAPASWVAADGTTRVQLPEPTVGYGFDVNPAADRLRVTAGTFNARMNPNTGAAVDGNLNNTMAPPAGTNPDASFTSGSTSGAAYTNSSINTTATPVTSLFYIDDQVDALLRSTAPNAGTVTGVGPLGVDVTAVNGFDIDSAVAVNANNDPATGVGYAALTVGGVTGLYTVSLSGGTATRVGTIGTGTQPITGLAVQRRPADGRPVVALGFDGTSLYRTNSTNPAGALNVTVAGITPNEALVAIAWRPQTGQLIGLGINATAETGSLYQIDPQSAPQSAAATVIGTAGSIAYAGTGFGPTGTVGYGIDLNPSVDRVRVVSSEGLNARINPNDGAPVDGNAGVVGVQPDGALTVGLSAVSYTNGFGRDLSAAAGATSEYGIDTAANTLVQVNPPNGGTTTNPKPITPVGTNGFDTFAGLDIPASVAVTTSNAAATGTAVAFLSQDGSIQGLYNLDLATGNITNLGFFNTTLRSIAAGEVESSFTTPVTTANPTTTPTTTPTPTPAAAPAVLVKTGKVKLTGKRKVDLGRSVTCPATSRTGCAVDVTVKSKGGKSRTVAKAIDTTVAAGTTKVLTTKLNAAGRKLVKAGRLKVKVAITYPGGPGAAVTTSSYSGVLKAKKKG